MNKILIVFFVFGFGLNVVNIIWYFKDYKLINVVLLVCNKSDVLVVVKVKDLGVEVFVVSNEEVENGFMLLQELYYWFVEWIILVGFFCKILLNLLRGFLDCIINVYFVLLLKFGGQGMYGMNVYKVVVEVKEIKSGIFIYLVNEEFDKGELLV